MPTSKLATWIVTAAVYAAASLGGGSAGAAPAPTVAQQLDNATCQSCHDGKKPKLEMLGSNGEKRPVQSVLPDKYAKSVHAKMECVACHKEIVDSVAPHKKADGVAKAECAQCHVDLWESIKKDNKGAERPRMGIVAENVAAYKKSFHAKPDKDDPTRQMAIWRNTSNPTLVRFRSALEAGPTSACSRGSSTACATREATALSTGRI